MGVEKENAPDKPSKGRYAGKAFCHRGLLRKKFR
jgi:hypothetical protein